MSEQTRWKAADGDNTFALDWDLNEDSHVWEIGGFEGRWAAQIVEKYNCHIEIFEPTQWGYGRCSERFFDNKNVTVHPYGLWVMNAHLPLYNPGNDGGSLLMAHERSEVCEFRDVFDEVAGDGIDLCLMNIEGAEFILLPYLIAYNCMPKFRQFWCQFHRFADPGGYRYTRIANGIGFTHKKKWDFYPTAVAWERM